ncbi:MAG: alanine:cation symporter family protein, partial [Candidatus Paceibacterales bacterium]
MTFVETLVYISDKALFIPFLALLGGSIILSFKTRFVQIRQLPKMFKMLFSHQEASKDAHMVRGRRALFTAMAATIGVGNIVAPIFAIGKGGPGALVGFMLAAFFGGATTFSEVVFSINYRKRFSDGTISGGPMQYLKEALHPYISYFYAISLFTLYIFWT